MKTRKISLLLFALLLCLTACARSNAHCYLCQGIPHDEPCIVDLATGDIAVLSAGDYGEMMWSSSGNIHVIGNNGKSSEAMIPAEAQEVNAGLFCDDCMAFIEATPNTGYVLADLHDLGHIQLYPIESGNSFAFRDYSIAIEAGEDGTQIVTVTE